MNCFEGMGCEPPSTGAGGSPSGTTTGSALRLAGLYTPWLKCCPSLPTHADHLTWAESAAVPGKPFAVLTHLYVTRPLLQTSARAHIPPRRQPPTLLWRRLWSPLRGASQCPWGPTPRGTAGFSRLPG